MKQPCIFQAGQFERGKHDTDILLKLPRQDFLSSVHCAASHRPPGSSYVLSTPRRKPGEPMTYEYIDEQIGFPHQTAGHRAKKPLPKRDIIAAAQAERQAQIEAQARQRNFQGNARMQQDALSRVRQRPVEQDDELCEDDDLYTRPPRSAIKCQPEESYRSGNTQINKYTAPPPAKGRHAIPPRRSAQQQPAQPYSAEEYREDIDVQAQKRPRRRRLHVHWLVFAGVGLLLMIAGWMAFTDLGVWWQNHTDDVTFGMPRTYQTDAVVGHGDSNSNPSHFIAINLRGGIYVIEAPGGNFSKARGYFITTEIGGNPNPPVTIKFEDLTHTGRLDMVVTIGDPPTPLTVFLFNNGSQFIGKQQ